MPKDSLLWKQWDLQTLLLLLHLYLVGYIYLLVAKRLLHWNGWAPDKAQSHMYKIRKSMQMQIHFFWHMELNLLDFDTKFAFTIDDHTSNLTLSLV